MFAVIRTGGKQYTVRAGDALRVEKLQAEAGEAVQFNEVLVVGDTVGAPLVRGAAVQATVLDQVKGDKVIHFVRRRRKHSSKRTKGHRQQLTLVRVTAILASGGEATGVRAALGAAFRAPAAATAPAAVLSGAAATVAATEAATVAEATKAPRRRAAKVVEAVADRLEDAVESVRDRAEDVAEAVADRVEDVAERVEDAASGLGKVALGAAAAVGVAAVAAAAAVLAGTGAKASDGDDETPAADDAATKE